MIPILIALLTIRVGPVAADAPAREPQMAANGNTVALAFGAGKTIYCSVSHDGGKSFSAPAKVAEAGILPLTRHRGPRIAFAGSAIVITAVTGNKPEEGAHAHGLPSDGDLFVWRSHRMGRARFLRRGWTTAAARARNFTARDRPMAGSHGRKISRFTNRPAGASANAAIPRWRWMGRGDCW